MNSTLEKYIRRIITEFDQIPENRKKSLAKIAWFVSEKVHNEKPVRLIFICTHNSRRSHMGQIWAQTAAYFYQIPGVEAYSGGTEATAFNPNAVAAMTKAGFDISIHQGKNNPVYEVIYAEDAVSVMAFSKKYNADVNPQKDFCAVMTCSQADAECPFIPGASLRIAIPYEDPKDYDGTDKESAAYAERCEQIAREMFYLFSEVKK